MQGFSINGIEANFLGDDNRLVSSDYMGPFNFYSRNTPAAGISCFWGSYLGNYELYPGMARN